jgi:hypothetical protein
MMQRMHMLINMSNNNTTWKGERIGLESGKPALTNLQVLRLSLASGMEKK